MQKSSSTSRWEHIINRHRTTVFWCIFYPRIEKPVHSSSKSVQEEKMKYPKSIVSGLNNNHTYLLLLSYLLCSIQLSAQWNELLITYYNLTGMTVSMTCSCWVCLISQSHLKLYIHVGTGILGVFARFSKQLLLLLISNDATIHNQSSRYITSLSTTLYCYCSVNVRFICTSAPWPTL